jgi:SNF2 family DNA or RNA helicase
MNGSPRKPRAPFRPAVDTLLSPQKPSFKQGRSKPARESSPSDEENSYLPETDNDVTDHSSIHPSELSHLGNSSSLFDERTPPASSPIYAAARTPHISKTPGNMARDREPPGGQPRAPPPAGKPLHERLTANETVDLSTPPTAAPEFGKASTMQSPLKNYAQRTQSSQVFNQPMPGRSRPEHHRDHQPIAIHRPNAPSQSTKPAPPKVSSRYSGASSDDSDIFEIQPSQFQARPSYTSAPVPHPTSMQHRTIHAPPRPVYSSVGHANGFQPVNRNQGIFSLESRKTVILDDVAPKRNSDDEDDFDPDTAIRAEGGEFGAPDLHAYVDSNQANENIKALLEGALDEENIPRTRGRKKKKQVDNDAAMSLADRLAALDVKEAETDKAAENEEEEEEDDGTVDGMKVNLLPHQVEGVAWMIEKETGAHNKRAKLPKGGILADDMGLGKTVQSIAVILSNPRPEKGVEPENKKNKILPVVGKGTLIVAPLALIKQWEAEINDKVSKSHSLKVLVHHGPNRTKSFDKLKTYDVVITTYQVLASEHASCGEGPNGLKKGCFGVHWYRVMLDEAHTIKNRNAKMTKACYEIQAHYRWCLTGTPMQNNLDELQSLIRFLRIQPYCDMPNWKDAITGPMKNGRGNLAMKRLQIFLKAFMKRRTKDVLKKEGALNFGGKSKNGEEKKGAFQIVGRNIETVIGEFTAKERSFYDRLNDRAESRLKEMMGGEKRDYIGALVLLLRLRQACNHPSLTKSNMKEDKDALTTGQKSGPQSGLQTPRKAAKEDDADDLADLLGGLTVETKRCDVCQTKLHSDNTVPGAIRCNECETDLNASVKKSKKHKKSHKHKHKDGKKEKHQPADSEDEDAPKLPKASRQRRVVVDSDDEDEAGGEWLVGEDEQGATKLGKAGGTDDENAEGGGDTLASVDSHASGSSDEDEDTAGSFIVHDTDSEEEGPVVRKAKSKKLSKSAKVIGLDSDAEDSSEADSDSSTEDDSEEDSGSEESDIEYNASDLTPSTKIRQLLTILEKETPDHKVIVFSQFTSMLDLIEPFLRRGGFNFTRYDGKMRNDHREASLAKLRNDKRCRVLICSLKCGSLGLNLTAASRVVIMEPFWNPVSTIHLAAAKSGNANNTLVC